MRIIFAGKGERGQKCLDFLVKNGYRPVLLVGEFKPKHHLPVFQPKNINSPESLSFLKRFKPDLLILASFTQILKKPVITLPKKGTINLHGGRLPDYRGAN